MIDSPIFEQHMPKLGVPAEKLVVRRPATDFSAAQPSRYPRHGDVNRARPRSTSTSIHSPDSLSRLVCVYNCCLPTPLVPSPHLRFHNSTQESKNRRSDHRVPSLLTGRFRFIPRHSANRDRVHTWIASLLPTNCQRKRPVKANDVCDWDCLRAQLTWVFVRAAV
jgi:hypothetical protein